MSRGSCVRGGMGVPRRTAVNHRRVEQRHRARPRGHGVSRAHRRAHPCRHRQAPAQGRDRPVPVRPLTVARPTDSPPPAPPLHRVASRDDHTTLPAPRRIHGSLAPPARPSLGRRRERRTIVRDHALEHERATSASWLPEATAHVVRASAPPRGPPREQVVAFCGSQSVPEAPIWGPPMARKAVKHNATAHSPAILALPAFRRTNPWHCA